MQVNAFKNLRLKERKEIERIENSYSIFTAFLHVLQTDIEKLILILYHDKTKLNFYLKFLKDYRDSIFNYEQMECPPVPISLYLK